LNAVKFVVEKARCNPLADNFRHLSLNSAIFLLQLRGITFASQWPS
jgi:hypothetical protein